MLHRRARRESNASLEREREREPAPGPAESERVRESGPGSKMYSMVKNLRKNLRIIDN